MIWQACGKTRQSHIAVQAKVAESVTVEGIPFVGLSLVIAWSNKRPTVVAAVAQLCCKAQRWRAGEAWKLDGGQQQQSLRLLAEASVQELEVTGGVLRRWLQQNSLEPTMKVTTFAAPPRSTVHSKSALA